MSHHLEHAPATKRCPTRRGVFLHILLLATLASTAGCGAAQAPRLLVDAETSKRPTVADEACAQAVFEVLVGSDGGVASHSVHLLDLHPLDLDPEVWVRMQAAAARHKWLPATTAAGKPGAAHALISIDCNGRGHPVTRSWDRKQARRAEQARRVRHTAAAALVRSAGADAEVVEHQLDILWSTLSRFEERMPFMFDEIKNWNAIAPLLERLQDAKGGFWVCRATRSTHTGQFLFFDGRRRLVATAPFWIGE